MATDANGVTFNRSWIASTGNLAADVHANVTAEGAGRLLATRLRESTDDRGMKNVGMPVPSDFPQEEERQEFSDAFLVHSDGEAPDDAHWTSGPSVDGKGSFEARRAEPMARSRG